MRHRGETTWDGPLEGQTERGALLLPDPVEWRQHPEAPVAEDGCPGSP